MRKLLFFCSLFVSVITHTKAQQKVIPLYKGKFHTLSINSEGIDVAKCLNAKGVAAFVLKYRLVHSLTDDPVKEMIPRLSSRKKLDSINAPVIPLAITDGLEAVKYVRTHAAEYGIDLNRIGFKYDGRNGQST